MKISSPLQLWQSEKVTSLLIDFFETNFRLAGIPNNHAQSYIEYIYKNKTKKDHEELRLYGNKSYSKFKDLSKNKPKEVNPLELLDLRNVKNILDVGSNKLATVNYLQEKYNHIYSYAVDVIPKRAKFHDESRAKYIELNSSTINYNIKPKSLDMVIYQFVLHHFSNSDDIKKSLNIAFKLLKKGGCLVLFEETFENFVSIASFKSAKFMGISVDDNFTNRFYSLSDLEKWEYITVNDWLINVSNPHIQWSFEYKTWEEWVLLLEETGFRLDLKYNLGLRVNGKLKQGVHIIGFFQKQ